jgi:hypothetical protein
MAMIHPMRAGTLMVVRVTKSAHRIPASAPGSAIRMMSGSSHEDIAGLQQAFLTGFKGAMMVCSAVAAAGLLATLVRGDEHPPASVAVGPARARHEP